MDRRITPHSIRQDKIIKSRILQRIHQEFQEEIAKINKEQQEILLDMIKLKESHE